jgi:hypothetical protein
MQQYSVHACRKPANLKAAQSEAENLQGKVATAI